MNMSSSSPTSVFDGMEAAPPDAIFNVLTKYKEDTFPKKVNLSVGGELISLFNEAKNNPLLYAGEVLLDIACLTFISIQ